MTKDKINDFILNYIDNDKTGRAIMLTSNWGSGKSYYIKNELKPFLEGKEKDCVIVSLYGFSNIFEISKAVLLEVLLGRKKRKLNPKLNKTIVTSGKIIGKTFLNSLANKIGIGIKDKDLKELSESLNFKNKLIVLDDVERTAIDIIELLGFINNLSENDNVKVLIVCNEDEFLKKKEEKKSSMDDLLKKYMKFNKNDLTENSLNYLEYKEKTISDTLNFENDIEDAYVNIINSFNCEKLSSIPVQDIIDKIGNINLRTFMMACQKSSDIYSKLPSHIDDEEFIKSILFGIIYFLVQLESETKLNWQGNDYYSIEYGFEDYPLFKFCYNYIVNHNLSFERIDECIENFNKLRDINYTDEKIKREIYVLYNYDRHKEEEVLQALDKIKTALFDSKNISIYEYAEIIYYLIKCHKLIGYDYSEFKELMKENLCLYADDINATSLFEKSLIRFNEKEDDEDYNLVKKYVDELTEAINLNSTIIQKFDYNSENISRFVEDVRKCKNKFVTSDSFATKLDIDSFFEMLKQCTPLQVDDIRNMFYVLYSSSGENHFKDDYKNIKLLKDKIDNYLKSYKGDRILKLQLERLSEYFDEFLKKVTPAN